MRLFLFPLLILLAVLSGCDDSQSKPPERPSWSFPAEGITKVKLRASRAAKAVVQTTPEATIKVSARPVLAANSYHAPDPVGRETPAHEWPFEIIASQEGSTLLLTIKGESIFRQHRYFLDALEIETPPGIEVIREHQAPATNSP